MLAKASKGQLKWVSHKWKRGHTSNQSSSNSDSSNALELAFPTNRDVIPPAIAPTEVPAELTHEIHPVVI
jgi:hypothetical protein